MLFDLLNQLLGFALEPCQLLHPESVIPVINRTAIEMRMEAARLNCPYKGLPDCERDEKRLKKNITQHRSKIERLHQRNGIKSWPALPLRTS